MPHLPPRMDLPTHSVENQPDARGDIDLFADDPALQAYVPAFGADPAHLGGFGADLGREEMRHAGKEANRHPPELVCFDAGGRRLDEVRFHPAYHRFLQRGLGAGYAAIPWEGRQGGHATHAAMVYLASQVEPGTCCPMTMTYAAVPALKAAPALFDAWVPKLTARMYDGAAKPLSAKTSATIGMAMTEKQGGSDVRANTTRAVAEGDAYRLYGHKWFCSAPMSDGFLTMAQARGGLTCFLVPRWLEEGRNGIQVQRLKDKLGNRSNASSEIEYVGAFAWRVGDEGEGVRTIIEMVHHTRLDTAMAPAGLMRAALREAWFWAQHRTAFQKRLADQPLMQTVLADLALDWEGALALGLRVACSFDSKRLEERAFARISVALAKYLSNKLCPGVVVEAMECLGGMGYVEDTPLPMLYREAPLNGIWEGSGNVICLDILRTLRASPEAGEVLAAEFAKVAGQDRGFDQALTEHMARFPKLPDEREARWFAESLATLLTGATLLQHAPSPVSEAYVATRLRPARGRMAGAIADVPTGEILARLGP
ncbi:MAG: acyl-CoA dehydrogenase family protein [Pseudomonadota bacterium]